VCPDRTMQQVVWAARNASSRLALPVDVTP
jgi:hypothetical protein